MGNRCEFWLGLMLNERVKCVRTRKEEERTGECERGEQVVGNGSNLPDEVTAKAEEIVAD